MPRVTQAQVAALAGTSQSTVSLVLNGAAAGRVAPQTIERVMATLRSSGYLNQRTSWADQKRTDRGRIIGVFTYEPVFPSVAADFFHPFLTGLERAAEAAQVDLLLFTSAHVDGRRRQLGIDQLQRVDGCVLLGRDIHTEDLAELNRSGFPYVSVGRRDAIHGPVAHVGADYVRATREMTQLVVAAGHRQVLYASCGSPSESTRDRHIGFLQGISGTSVTHERLDRTPARELLDHVQATRTSCVIFDEARDAEAFIRLAVREGHIIGADLSVVLLHEPIRPLTGIDLTRFAMPRIDMGRRALEVLLELLAADPATARTQFQELFPITITRGTSLGPGPGPISSARTTVGPSRFFTEPAGADGPGADRTDVTAVGGPWKVRVR